MRVLVSLPKLLKFTHRIGCKQFSSVHGVRLCHSNIVCVSHVRHVSTTRQLFSDKSETDKTQQSAQQAQQADKKPAEPTPVIKGN